MDSQNYFEMLKDLKRRIDEHEKKMFERNEIISEFKDVTNLLNDIRKYINELKHQYSILPTDELRVKLDEYFSEEKDYLALLNEYASKIDELNHSENFEIENQFLQLALEFQKISNRIKEIEKISKKFGSKKEIGTNRVETITAEGRKQYIHENYLAEYNELVAQKRKMLPVYKRMYKEFIDNQENKKKSESVSVSDVKEEYFNNEKLAIAPTYIPSDEEYAEMSNQDKIDLEKKYYEDMTLDEKISYCKNILNTILTAKNTGKKNLIKIGEEKYYVPVRMKDLFFKYHRTLKLLLDEKNKKATIDQVEAESTTQSLDQKSEDKSIIPFSKESGLSVVNKSMIPVSRAGGLSIADSNILSGEYVGNYKQNGNVYETDYVEIDSNAKNVTDKKKKEFKILKIRKPKNLKKLIKSLVAATVAIITAIVTYASAHMFWMNNKKPDVTSSSNEQILDDSDNFVHNDDDKILNDIVEKINKGRKESTEDTRKPIEEKNIPGMVDSNSDDIIHLGDKVVIANDIIYSDVYRAKDNIGGLPAYHENDKIREVYGIFLSNGDDYRYIINNQSEIDELLSQGWIIKSVVMKNEAGLEGAEPIENIVKVQENSIGGRNR